MAFNGTGTFLVDSAGQPVVSGTVISSTVFNALTADLALGLSTCITKDGQTTATQSIPFAAGISVTGTATLNSGVVLNESGGDNDIRFESDANVNHYTSDAGVFSGVGAHGFGPGVLTNVYFTINPPALTAIANTNFYQFHIGGVSAMTIPAGTTSNVATAIFNEPNLVATGTITTASTVYISGAPTEGVANWAMFVNAGAVRINDGLTLNGALTYGSVTLSNAVTGTGKMVLDTSPTLVTPVLGAATGTSLVLSSTITALASTKNAAMSGGNATVTSEQDLTGATVSLDRDGKWLILATFHWRIDASSAAADVAGFINVDGSNVTEGTGTFSLSTTGANDRTTCTTCHIATIASQPKTAKLRASRTSGTGTVTVFDTVTKITAHYLGTA